MPSTDARRTRTGERTRTTSGAAFLGGLGLLVVAVAIGIAFGWTASRRSPRQQGAHHAAWVARVGCVVRDGRGAGGLVATEAGGASRSIGVGDEVRAGTTVRSDARTRARLDVDHGSLILDRASSIALDEAGRALRTEEGVVLVDVAGGEARLVTPRGTLDVEDGALTVSVMPDRVGVDVMRGAIALRAASGEVLRVEALHEAVLAAGAGVEVLPTSDLATRAAFADDVGAQGGGSDAAPGEAGVSSAGLGELRGRRPGRADEKDHVVRLASHAVRVRISGAAARTEIDETFHNDGADDLEAVYRFPLPHGAVIQRLALEVDGKLVEGAFVDKRKASAIWRGAIQHAAPSTPRTRDEIVWVPGPWKDPAVLEWRGAGRFELRIFPVPRRGERRVVLAYTETLPRIDGRRRYVYPLPRATGGAPAPVIARFDLDVQILGAAPPSSVRLRGYEVAREDLSPRAVRFAQAFTSFAPAGDLAVDFVADSDAGEASTWAYRSAADGGAAYVAVALRPRLPAWEDGHATDEVVIVDSGRAAAGGRLRIARRLAAEMAQQMDRRDRLTVLACDLGCRALPGGFRAPGSAAAHDVDAFLSGVSADGASDLVGAVRAAARIPGRDSARDLRVVLLGGGAPSAGYLDSPRLAIETREALGDARGALVAVAIGGDEGIAALSEMVRGGAGVLVPYAGDAARAALDVLSAAHGRALTDVTVTMPAGVTDVAGADPAPLRAGGEWMVAGRVHGDRVRGDVILRGKVGGEPFERRYAIDAAVTDDAGNAFVPRLFATARIADAERAGRDGDLATRAEIVALSARHAVPSRFTSLLVLESEAMFRAFAIDRTTPGAGWTGEEAARAGEVIAPSEPVDDGSALLSQGAAPYPATARAAPAESRATHGGDASSSFDRTAPTPTSLPDVGRPPPPDLPWPRAPRGRWMKRVWTRLAEVRPDGSPVGSVDRVATARAALDAAPDDRGRLLALAAALAAADRIDDLDVLVTRASRRDPLDPDLVAARADVAVARGDRDAARRIASGLLASAVARGGDVAGIAAALARSLERADDPSACALRVTVAASRADDPDALARAVACERASGATGAADRWLDAAGNARRTDVAARAAKLASPKPDAASGDVVLEATWDAAADLDLVVVDARGQRIAWSSDVRGAASRVIDPRDRSHEILALGALPRGAYSVALVRGEGAVGPPVHGRLAVRAYGAARTVPFVLDGARIAVARVDVRWSSTLVPVDGFTPAGPSRGAFDPSAARRVLDGASLAACRDADGVASGLVRVTFDGDGHVRAATLDGLASGSAAAGQCVARVDHSAIVAPFDPGAGASPVLLHRYVLR